MNKEWGGASANQNSAIARILNSIYFLFGAVLLLPMNNPRRHASLQASDLAEGTQEITNTLELTTGWKRSSIVPSDVRINGHSAEEGPQIGVEREGQDAIDSQDAPMSAEEASANSSICFLKR